MSRTPFLPFVLGSVVLFVAERTLTDTARLVGLGLAGVLLVLGLGWAARRAFSAKAPDSLRAARLLLVAYLVATAGMALYAVSAYLLPAGPSDTRTLLQVGWPVLYLLGLLPALTMELALAGMQGAPRLELFRLGFAARSAAVFVLAVVAFAGLNFAANRWSKKIDVSYFKTTRPSEVTKKLVEGLSAPARVLLFFPQGNDVLEQVRPYFDELSGPQLSVEVLDQALEPDLAKELKVRTNGHMVLKGERASEPLDIGLDVEDARGTLKKLDKEVHERLLEISRGPRVAYLTVGHNERDTSVTTADQRAGLNDFKSLLESVGFTVKRLGLGEGLGTAVPEDARLVVVAGPTEPFLPSELSALTTYVQKGGRLLVMLDPDQGEPLHALLAPFGVKLEDGLVASDKLLVRVEGRSDSPYNFATTRFLNHPSVTSLARASSRMAVVVMGAGSLGRVEPAPPGYKLTTTMRAADSWLDVDGNGRLDAEREAGSKLAKETRGQPELAVAIATEHPKDAAKDAPAGPEARLIVVSDADLAGTGIVRNSGNAYFFLDGVKWLAGDEALTGELTSEEDVQLVHKKEGDAVWFYGTSFLVPAAVLFGGLYATRRHRRRS